MGYTDHQRQAHAAAKGPVRCAILTISDTRSAEQDTSGAAIRSALNANGHDVVHYRVVRDEPQAIVAAVQAFVADQCQLIVTNGGTGIAQRDGTFEAIDALLDKRLPGFGELFRMLSYNEIGAGAMLSRATAGLIGSCVIFVLPGSTNAVQLALEKLILPEIEHLVWETLR